MTSLDDDFNETETREFITDPLKAKGWKLKLNMRYEYKITDGRVQIDEEGESYRSEALFADYFLYAPNNQPLCVVEAKRANQIEGTGIQQAINYCNLLNAPFAASSNGKSFVFTSLLSGHEEEFSMDEEIEKCTVQKGDLLVCEGGEVGRSAIWNYERTVCIQNHIHRLRVYNSQLNILFYYHVLHLFKESKIIDNYAKGIGIKGLSSNALGSIIVPLPPLDEQEEIVKKVEELLEL